MPAVSSDRRCKKSRLDHDPSRAGAQVEAGKNGTLTYCVQVGSWILLSRSIDLLIDASRNAKMASGGLQVSEIVPGMPIKR